MSSTVLILLVATFFLLMGILALARPERILGPFGVSSLGTAGRNEVRAVYGGFGIGVALLLIATLWFDSLQAGVLIAVAVALFGMAMGRVVSAAIDRALGFYPLVFLVIEIVLAAMLLAAL